MKKKKLIVYILLFVLLVLGSLSVYIYKEYNRTHKDTAVLQPDYSLTAAGLLNEFELDEPSSNKKYWDKILLVGGVVKDVTMDDRGHYSLILGDSSSLSSVRCSIDSTHSQDAKFARKGEWLTMKGICAGFNADELLGSDVILVRCVVDSRK